MTAKLQLTDEEIKEYYLRRLEELALSHIGDIPQVDEPTYAQKQWILQKLKDPPCSWRRYC